MDIGMIRGDVPIKNWTIGEDIELSTNLGGPSLSEKYLTRAHACSNCPIACKRIVQVKEGSYQTEEGPGPEYETCCAFGTLIMNYDLAAVIKANELCNRYGMDAMCHAIEALHAIPHEPISDGLALHALRLHHRYLPVSVETYGHRKTEGEGITFPSS